MYFFLKKIYKYQPLCILIFNIHQYPSNPLAMFILRIILFMYSKPTPFLIIIFYLLNQYPKFILLNFKPIKVQSFIMVMITFY
jgi:hypothetical protein